jgi:hypothetical protein
MYVNTATDVPSSIRLYSWITHSDKDVVCMMIDGVGRGGDYTSFTCLKGYRNPQKNIKHFFNSFCNKVRKKRWLNQRNIMSTIESDSKVQNYFNRKRSFNLTNTLAHLFMCFGIFVINNCIIKITGNIYILNKIEIILYTNN